jgi:hypothetical protein
MLGCNFDVDEIQVHKKTWPFKVKAGPAGEIVIKVKGAEGPQKFTPLDIHTMFLKHM